MTKNEAYQAAWVAQETAFAAAKAEYDTDLKIAGYDCAAIHAATAKYHAALAASYRTIAKGMEAGSISRQDQEQMTITDLRAIAADPGLNETEFYVEQHTKQVGREAADDLWIELDRLVMEEYASAGKGVDASGWDFSEL